MSDPTKIDQTSNEGKPLRINELDIEGLAQWLHDNKIRTTQGKIISPLHAAHLEILSDPARFKVLACGRRFGKSLLAALTALAVLMQPSRTVWIIAPSYDLAEKVFREVYNILVNQLKLVIPGKKGQARSQKGDYFIKTEWGSILQAKSAENPDSLAGEAVDLVIFDEAALEPKLEDVWNMMINPTLIDKSGSALFISTPRGKNNFYKLFLLGEIGKKQRTGKLAIGKDEETGMSNDVSDWSSFQKTSYDNPLLSSSPELAKKEIDDAYRRASLTGKVLKFKQEYLADFEAIADSCFPGFVEEINLEHEYANIIDYDWHPDEGPVFASCDHNFAKPASTIFAQINKFGDIVIFDERFTKHTTSYMQAQQILDKEDSLNKKAWQTWEKEQQVQSQRHNIVFQQIIGDISGNQSQLNGRAAWDDFEAVLGKNRRPVGLKQDRETGCNMMRHWLQFPQFDQRGSPLLDDKGQQVTRPKLFVTRNCVNVIYALSTAKFKKGKEGSLKEDYEETPEGYEGLLDAIRYLLVYLFHDRGQHLTVVKGF